MIDSTKPIDDATPLDDISGLKLPKNKTYTPEFLNFFIIESRIPNSWYLQRL